jgi:diguanylate cyclase (GGDEF)-like protein
MLTDFPIQAILDRLVERIVDILPVTSAGVTLISEEVDPQHVAASDASALRFVLLQEELGEGPCIAACRTGRPVTVPDLRRDRSFPRFGARALQDGLAAVFSFPLHDGDDRLGALDLYRETPGPLGHSAMAAAETLADVTAAYILNARARMELVAASDRSRALAMHDGLTGLPNRILLLERLGHAVQRGARSGKVAAVLFADLDDFKTVNDRHGHRTGDELLVQVARRLESVIRPGDTLARISGDEFVVLCEDLDDVEEADEIAVRLVEAMAPPFSPSGAPVRVGVSVGVASSRRGGLSEHLLELADKAMYQAKRGGGGQHQSLDESTDPSRGHLRRSQRSPVPERDG